LLGCNRCNGEDGSGKIESAHGMPLSKNAETCWIDWAGR
jgi:hypothetical protein